MKADAPEASHDTEPCHSLHCVMASLHCVMVVFALSHDSLCTVLTSDEELIDESAKKDRRKKITEQCCKSKQMAVRSETVV